MRFLWMSRPPQRGYRTCMAHGSFPGSQQEVRGKRQFRLRAHSPREGHQSSARERDLHQLRNRAHSTKKPRSHLAGSATEYAHIFIRFHGWYSHRASKVESKFEKPWCASQKRLTSEAAAWYPL